MSSALSVAFCLILTSSGRADANDLLIEVDANQRTTVVGSHESLKTALEELCDLAGIRLLGFESDDRAFTADYEDEPVDRVLARLLRPGNYAMGMKAGPDDTVRITWLHVVRGADTKASPPTGTRPIPTDLWAKVEPPPPEEERGLPDYLQFYLGHGDAQVRSEGAREIAKALDSEPGARESFLSQPPASISGSLGHYEHSQEFLREVRRLVTDGEVREHLGRLLE